MKWGKKEAAFAFVLVVIVLSAKKGRAMSRSLLNPSTGKPVSSRSLPALSHLDLIELVTRHGFKDVDKAVAIAERESGGHPDAVADTRGMSPEQLFAYWGKPAMQEFSIGLWQINLLAHPQYDAESLKDPEYAAHAAFEISDGGTNWAAWGG